MGNKFKVETYGTIDFSFTKKGFGFGQIYFGTDEEGIVSCGNECMSKETIKQILCDMVDDCILLDD